MLVNVTRKRWFRGRGLLKVAAVNHVIVAVGNNVVGGVRQVGAKVGHRRTRVLEHVTLFGSQWQDRDHRPTIQTTTTTTNRVGEDELATSITLNFLYNLQIEFLNKYRY